MNDATIMGAVTFLGGSVLIAVSILVLVAVVVAVNNIIHRFWKPMHWFEFQDNRPQYIVPGLKPIEPQTDEHPTYKTRTKETTK